MVRELHTGGGQLATPSMEDYIEQIYLQLEAKGEARVSDVAEALWYCLHLSRKWHSGLTVKDMSFMNDTKGWN